MRRDALTRRRKKLTEYAIRRFYFLYVIGRTLIVCEFKIVERRFRRERISRTELGNRFRSSVISVQFPYLAAGIYYLH